MVLRRAVRYVDERSGVAPFLSKSLRYLFPDHWSFLLGEVALYAFIVLVATGIYLTLYFEPSLAKTTYHGTYEPLRGTRMSDAYRSAVDISFKYKAGLLVRQTHHWAADVFVAAIVMHLIRVFFTGAFRKPRELTWLVGWRCCSRRCSRATSATRWWTTCCPGWDWRSDTASRCRSRSSGATSRSGSGARRIRARPPSSRACTWLTCSSSQC